MHRSLFCDLLGDDTWQKLSRPVQAMHGSAPRLVAKRMADGTGVNHLPARWLRRVLMRLPWLGQLVACNGWLELIDDGN